jgi:hypothetical protein
MVLQISEAGAIYDGVTVVFAHTLPPEEQGTTTLVDVFRLAIVNDVGTFLKKIRSRLFIKPGRHD